MENRDHKNLKFEIRDYLRENGWEAEIEHIVSLLKESDKRFAFDRIWVDVVAFKDGKLYMAEIGAMMNQTRKRNLEKLADVFDHLPIGRQNFRNLNESKWDSIYEMSTKIPGRGLFDEKKPNREIAI